jgi:TonB family protein
MKPLVLCLSLILFSACSSTQESTGIILPELFYQHPLPAFPKPLTASQLRINLKIFVGENGSVRDVELLNSSGSYSWDSAATNAIRQWKYSPARYDGKPVSIWLRQTAVVKFSDPQYIHLAEIVFASMETADSALALLERGVDFSEITRQYSISPSRSSSGSLGVVNVQIFPEQVKKVLLKLEIGAYTAPLKYGEQFVIFKRINE